MSAQYVEFPQWGLQIPVSRVLFRIGPLDIYTYAVIIAFALVLMIFLGIRACERYGIRQETIIDMMICALPSAIVCARAYYVIFSWDQYKGDLLSIVNTRNGGLAIYGGVIGAFAAIFIFCKVRKLKPLIILDFGAPYLILAQGIGRWGNFVNQEAFGGNTTMPWGMTSPEIQAYLSRNAEALSQIGMTVDPAMPVHPTFFYEFVWAVLVSLLLFRVRRWKHFHGEVLCLYLIGYGLGRAFIEGLRTDSLMLGPVRISQILSVAFVLVFSVIYFVQRAKHPRWIPLPWVELPPQAAEESGQNSETEEESAQNPETEAELERSQAPDEAVRTGLDLEAEPPPDAEGDSGFIDEITAEPHQEAAPGPGWDGEDETPYDETPYDETPFDGALDADAPSSEPKGGERAGEGE